MRCYVFQTINKYTIPFEMMDIRVGIHIQQYEGSMVYAVQYSPQNTTKFEHLAFLCPQPSYIV